MKVIYFAWIKEITKIEEEMIINNEIQNLDNFKKYLIKKYPNLKKHIQDGILRFAVNQDYIVDDIELFNDDEIAVFPPVSGG
tara:strand:- start:8178 stop:8423 length:246 start_codon:yes stop_codon:yes gene_type:complete